MLNMLLAIIMDVYTEVRGGISRSAPTLWGQAYSIIRRRWELSRGRRVSLQHVYTSLELILIERAFLGQNRKTRVVFVSS